MKRRWTGFPLSNLLLQIIRFLRGHKVFFLIFLFVSLELYQLASESTSITSAVSNIVFQHNLHEVVPGRLYRSAEMKPGDLKELMKEKGIKSIIDLRMNPKAVPESYFGESEAVESLGASYKHFPLMGSKEMELEQVKNLLSLLDRVETPVLVHCSSGTHRSGLVSAIWLMEKEGVPFNEAKEQLSSKYGFFLTERKLKSLVSGRWTIDNILWRYQEANSRSPIAFREWVERGMP